ncbi:MAG: DUF3298 and DUF4163 domain-containing protein [Dysgonamonadaceae bacterium]|jgi:hypothetical protein|nr:DUF3298 and DUF4163 domain-containing protein [Dysgonamonadaceae bacterium]
MEKAINRYIVLDIILLFFCTSCNWNKTKTADDTISFDTIHIDETQPSENVDSNVNICCHLSITFIYPDSYSDSDKLHKLQSAFIERMFSMRYAGLSPHQAVDSFRIQYIKDFQGEKFSNEDYNLEDESGFQYYLDLKNEITYNGNHLISFLVKNEVFEGGAHGAHSIFGYVIDLNTGEYITEDSFAGIDYKKNLSGIIVKKIAEANKVSDPKQLENMGYNNIDDIVPNGNFTIDEKGITYYFNEYEIASYFIGITKVFIPYEELKIFTTDDNNPIAALVK